MGKYIYYGKRLAMAVFVVVFMASFTMPVMAATGYTWTEQTGSGVRSWTALASSADGTKLVASADGTTPGYIYTSTDGGLTWTERTNAGLRDWAGLASSADGTKLTAVVNGGYIYTSTDSGVTWTERTSAGVQDWAAVAASTDGTKLVASDDINGYIYTSTNSGVTWVEQTGSGARAWSAVDMSQDGSMVVATDSGGYVYTSADGGVTWTQQTNSGARSWYGITVSNDGTKLAAADASGYIYTSTDGGVTWTECTSAGSRVWQTVDSSANGNIIIAAALYDYVYVSEDGGATWSQYILGGTFGVWTSVNVADNGAKLFATNSGGYIYSAAAAGPIVSSPGDVTDVAATAGDGEAYLTWSAPADDGGSPITDYKVEYSSDAGATWMLFAHPASTATSMTVTGLTNGINYLFRVSAVNAVGGGAPQVSTAAVTPVPPNDPNPDGGRNTGENGDNLSADDAQPASRLADTGDDQLLLAGVASVVVVAGVATVIYARRSLGSGA